MKRVGKPRSCGLFGFGFEGEVEDDFFADEVVLMGLGISQGENYKSRMGCKIPEVWDENGWFSGLRASQSFTSGTIRPRPPAFNTA